MPDSIVDRFCLLGPASSHIERLAENGWQNWSPSGATSPAVYLMHDDEDATLDAYGSEIIPALSR